MAAFCNGPLSVSKKSAYGVLFRDLRRFPLAPMGLPGGKRRKETLHSKASESAAHVAGFGLHLEGYGPPNHPKRFFDSLRARCKTPRAKKDEVRNHKGVSKPRLFA